MSKICKNLSKKQLFVEDNDHLSMYAHESTMKLSYGGTLDTSTACRALKKFYMKRTKIFEYKTDKYLYAIQSGLELLLLVMSVGLFHSRSVFGSIGLSVCLLVEKI